MLDRAILIERLSAGEKCTYLFFWGHTVSRDSSIGKSCLSQWYPASFNIDGLQYPTAEHWMMASKAKVFGDDEALQKILAAPDPKTAKALSRRVRNFDDAVWNANARRMVTERNLAKFKQNLPLRDFLLSTGDAVIVEASPRDSIWGIGLAQENPEAQHPSTWRGKNLLGFALMDVRQELRDAEAVT